MKTSRSNKSTAWRTRPDFKPTNLREALDVIQELLSDKRYSQDLWNVLTALRGPDERDVYFKNATTAVIRQKAFPECPAEYCSVFKEDRDEYAFRRKSLFDQELNRNHFREHIRDAFDSLGLKLTETNL